MIGFAKKIGMTRLFKDGVHTPVTVLEVETQYVLQIKQAENDGYNAVQVGAVGKKKGTQPAKGHVKKYAGIDKALRFVAEFRDFDVSDEKKTFDINDISENDVLTITGTTIGRGFAGVMKRHGFHGQPQSHGHDHVRAPGSIGARWPQRVLPGKKMAGRMGGIARTIRGAKVVAVDLEEGLIFVKGSLPGANNSYVKIRKEVNS